MCNALRFLIIPAVLAIAACDRTDAAADAPDSQPHRPGGIEYVVTVDPSRPGRLQASVDLAGHAGTATTAAARGQDFGLVPQVLDPSCDGVALAGNGPGKWLLPRGCRVLRWEIDVRDAVANGTSAADQSTLHFADVGWWLLSEPTSLLRPDPLDGSVPLSLRVEGVPGSDAVIGATKAGERHWRVPPVSHAPEFYVFGTPKTQTHDFGRLQATYVIDDEARFRTLPLLDLHRQTLEYFSDLFGVPEELPEPDRHLLVVWLGIDEAHGHAGGAAGGRSFIANYVDGDPGNVERNAVRTMLVLAHEQVHQLFDLLWRGEDPLPAWFNESLAQHYALKALARSDLDGELLSALHAAFVAPDAPVEAGLAELGRRHEAGDAEAYGMFYSQGATFWAEVDRLLEAGHPGPHGLDALLPELLATGGDGSGLPPSLRARLVERGGPEMEAVVARYVGD